MPAFSRNPQPHPRAAQAPLILIILRDSFISFCLSFSALELPSRL